MYPVSGNIFDRLTQSILIFKLRKYWRMHECLKNGCDARPKVCHNQWLNIQLKARNKWSIEDVQDLSMASSVIWMLRHGLCILQQIPDDA